MNAQPHQVRNNKSRYFAMNNLKIRNDKNDYIASSTCYFVWQVGKEQKVYIFCVI